MIDLQYPPSHYKEPSRTKKKTTGMLFIVFIIGVAIGGINYNYPNNPEPIIILDPIDIPSDGELGNNLDTITYRIDRAKKIELVIPNYQGVTLYIHTHNISITEFYFDFDLVLVTDSIDTFIVDDIPQIIEVFTDGLIFVTLWFWETN